MRLLRLAAAALAAGLLLAGTVRAQFGPTPVYLEPAEKRSIRRTVEIIGTAEARRHAVIGAEVAGRVEKMEADAGDALPAEGVLCRMRTRPVALQLEQAKGRLASAQADLAKMEAGYRAEDVAQAKARVAAAQAEFERWRQEYERTKKLLADGASTQAEMDATEAAYRTAREKLAEAQAGLALLEAGYRVEDVAKARAEVAAQAAAVGLLEDTLEKMTVRTPFAAFVIRKMCEEGEWLSPGSPVAEVVDLGVVRIQLDVPERFLPGMERGTEAPVVFPALGEDRQFNGRVTQVVPASAAGTHTVPVRVDVANETSAGRPVLAAGLAARVSLPVGAEHEALLVPKAALIRREGRDFVYTVADERPKDAKPSAAPEAAKDPGQAKMIEANEKRLAEAARQAGVPLPPVKYAVEVPVRIVAGYGSRMEVESDGLADGTPLVTRGTYLLAHGSPVRLRPKEGTAGPDEPPRRERRDKAAGQGAGEAGGAGG
jgi:multidrug efflux pump subunit AcrA (membrane-fusion protein)